MMIPVRLAASAAKLRLFSCLISRQLARKSGSSASGSSALSSDRSLIQPSPMRSVMRLDSRGLASAIQRRGVTPLVLLLNLPGQSS